MFHQKSMHGAFLIFCMELHRHKDLKLTEIMFLGKILRISWSKKT